MEMTRRMVAATAAILPVLALLALSGGSATAQGPSIPFEDVRMIIEVNSTDGDAGFQFFLDAESSWRSIQIYAPSGRKLLDIDAKGKLKDFGMTELFSESNEPPFDELPLQEFLARFPAGDYRFVGTTVDGRKLTGTATFSHDIPAGPVLVSPDEGAVVTGDVVIEWEPVPEPAGIDIVGYQVIVEGADPLRVFQVDLASTATSVTVPPEFLAPNTEYAVEVLAIETSGNQTITQASFVTS